MPMKQNSLTFYLKTWRLIHFLKPRRDPHQPKEAETGETLSLFPLSLPLAPFPASSYEVCGSAIMLRDN